MKEITSSLTRVLVVTLLSASALMTDSPPTSAQAACTRWDMSGEWEFVQTNDTAPNFRLQQTMTAIQGSAHYSYRIEGDCPFFASCGHDVGFVDASVDGSIKGDYLEVTAYWNNGTIGVYTGRINPHGRIEGSAYDKLHPQTTALWYSNRTAKCLTTTGERTGTTSSALKTAPVPPPVRPPRRVSVPKAPSTLSECQSAEIARVRNSPAAPGLTAQCFAIVNDLAAKGGAIANQDPAAVALRSQQPEGPARRGFDIGMGAAEGQTMPGPGKDAIRDSLPAAERQGFIAAVSFSLRRNRQKLTDLAPRGAEIAQEDPLATELRNQQPDDAARLGFDIGMAAAEKQTADGPGKQRMHDSLAAEEKKGFAAAVAFSLERNRNAQRAATGAAIISEDAVARSARNAEANVFYRLGFDIATAIFGDPKLGAQGNTSTGPGSLGVRDSLSAAGQRGFNAAVTFHLSKNYQVMREVTWSMLCRFSI